MPVSIAVVSGKGGATKTETVGNISVCLSNMGYESLLVDVDPQSNLSIRFDVHSANKKSLEDLLSIEDLNDIIYSSRNDKINIIPNSFEKGKRMRRKFESEEGDDKYSKLGILESIEGYDFILYDCPPSLDNLTMNVLAVCDYVLVPVVVDSNGIEGLRYIVNSIKSINQTVNSKLNLLGIFVNMDRKTALHRDVKDSLKESFKNKFLETSIPFSDLVPRCSFENLNICEKYPKNKTSMAYAELVKEIIKIIER